MRRPNPGVSGSPRELWLCLCCGGGGAGGGAYAVKQFTVLVNQPYTVRGGTSQGGGSGAGSGGTGGPATQGLARITKT